MMEILLWLNTDYCYIIHLVKKLSHSESNKKVTLMGHIVYIFDWKLLSHI